MTEEGTRTAILLEGSLSIYPKENLKYNVSVTNAVISYVRQEQYSSRKALQHVIKFSDVIGMDCMRGKQSARCTAYLNVYSYPHRKKFGSSRTVRTRRCITFVFLDFPSFEENHRDAVHWQLVMTHCIHKTDVSFAGNQSRVSYV